MPNEAKAPTVGAAVEAYLKLRDDLDYMKARHKEEEAEIKSKMEKFESFFHRFLESNGGENFKTAAGTIYKSRRTSAKVEDWERALDFIRTNGYWHMLQRSVSKSAVEQYIEQNEEPVPGISIQADLTINIRRS